VIFVVVIMFMPYGLVPGCTQLWRRWRNRSRPAHRRARNDPRA